MTPLLITPSSSAGWRADIDMIIFRRECDASRTIDVTFFLTPTKLAKNCAARGKSGKFDLKHLNRDINYLSLNVTVLHLRALEDLSEEDNNCALVLAVIIINIAAAVPPPPASLTTGITIQQHSGVASIGDSASRLRSVIHPICSSLDDAYKQRLPPNASAAASLSVEPRSLSRSTESEMNDTSSSEVQSRCRVADHSGVTR